MRWPWNRNEDIGTRTLHGGSWRRCVRRPGRFSARTIPPATIGRTSMAKQPRILAGETAAVTGAARGIGRATAEAFLRKGMKVAIGDVDIEAARNTAAELGASTIALPLDVTDRTSFSDFLDATEQQLGPL